MTEEHSSPIKTPKQLLIVVLLAFAVPIVLVVLLSQLVTSTEHGLTHDTDMTLSRIQPVATLAMAEFTGPKGALTGQQVYGQVCKSCHDAGLAGAPKAGDKAAWAPRIAQGESVLDMHAIAGYTGKAGVMPAKGGSADLTDDEVKRAVAFMANQAGATFKEPPITTVVAADAAPAASPAAVTATPAAATPTPAPAPPVAPVAAPAAAPVVMAAAGGNGKKTYESGCVACHGSGLIGAPKFGDKAAWEPRIKTGMDTLYNAAIKGMGAMPPKGGNTSLPDADVKAAVDFMVAAAK